MDWQNYKSETTTIKFFFFCLPLEILFDGDLVFAASWDSQNAVILGKKLIWGHFNTSINCFYPPYNYLNVFSSLGTLIACFGIGSHSFWQTDELLFYFVFIFKDTETDFIYNWTKQKNSSEQSSGILICETQESNWHTFLTCLSKMLWN